jgi:membrane-bound lytic murein transglycosylase MltF
VKFIQLGLLQKEIVYTHLNYAYSKYIKAHHNKIMRREVKDRIMAMVNDPEDKSKEMLRPHFYAE